MCNIGKKIWVLILLFSLMLPTLVYANSQTTYNTPNTRITDTDETSECEVTADIHYAYYVSMPAALTLEIVPDNTNQYICYYEVKAKTTSTGLGNRQIMVSPTMVQNNDGKHIPKLIELINSNEPNSKVNCTIQQNKYVFGELNSTNVERVTSLAWASIYGLCTAEIIEQGLYKGNFEFIYGLVDKNATETIDEQAYLPPIKTIVAKRIINSNLNEHQHIPGEIIIENEVSATCTDTGSYDEVIYCIDCNEELSREFKVVDARGHSWNVNYESTTATCTTDGISIFKCKNCDAIKEETESALGCTYENGECIRCGNVENPVLQTINIYHHHSYSGNNMNGNNTSSVAGSYKDDYYRSGSDGCFTNYYTSSTSSGWYSNCSSCGGTGRTSSTCSSCGGTGSKSSTCSSCSGTGKITGSSTTCTKCAGAGTVKERCTGTVTFEKYDYGRKYKEVCTVCGVIAQGSCVGMGLPPSGKCTRNVTTTCSSCSGKGTITSSSSCTSCGGTGSKSSTCSSCSGTGRKSSTCSSCSGTGHGTYHSGTTTYYYNRGCGHTEGEILATITVNLNGGTVSNLYAESNGNITLNKPSRTGYEFLGWVIDDTAPNQTVTISERSDFSNKTYKAMWKRN